MIQWNEAIAEASKTYKKNHANWIDQWLKNFFSHSEILFFQMKYSVEFDNMNR